jgi:hypothetical protein
MHPLAAATSSCSSSAAEPVSLIEPGELDAD